MTKDPFDAYGGAIRPDYVEDARRLSVGIGVWLYLSRETVTQLMFATYRLAVDPNRPANVDGLELAPGVRAKHLRVRMLTYGDIEVIRADLTMYLPQLPKASDEPDIETSDEPRVETLAFVWKAPRVLAAGPPDTIHEWSAIGAVPLVPRGYDPLEGIDRDPLSASRLDYLRTKVLERAEQNADGSADPLSLGELWPRNLPARLWIARKGAGPRMAQVTFPRDPDLTVTYFVTDDAGQLEAQVWELGPAWGEPRLAQSKPVADGPGQAHVLGPVRSPADPRVKPLMYICAVLLFVVGILLVNLVWR